MLGSLTCTITDITMVEVAIRDARAAPENFQHWGFDRVLRQYINKECKEVIDLHDQRYGIIDVALIIYIILMNKVFAKVRSL